MKKVAYTAKSGLRQFKPVITGRSLGENKGFCLACGKTAPNVEPDARRYVCPSCSAPKVYGLEELLLMGLTA